MEQETRTFEWMTEHQEAFDALKEALCTAPVLGYPNFSREFILETDASLKGLGTVLSQQQKGWEHPCNSLRKPIFMPI